MPDTMEPPAGCLSAASFVSCIIESLEEIGMRKILLATLTLLLLATAPTVLAQQRSTVTLLHFSDYHSHAVPFYSEGQADTAGIARLIAYLQPYANDPNSLIFNGGDTMNLGTPAWSDKYH